MITVQPQAQKKVATAPQVKSFLAKTSEPAQNLNGAQQDLVKHYANLGSGTAVDKNVPTSVKTLGSAATSVNVAPTTGTPTTELPKVDTSKLWADKQQQTTRDNALRTKTAVDQAEQQAYYAGGVPGTKDYQSFITRSQANADSTNLQALANLQDYGSQLAEQQDETDRKNLDMMLDSVGDDPDAKRKLVANFLNSGTRSSESGSLGDAYSSMVGNDGSLSSAKTEYDKALQSEMEYMLPASLNPGSEYYGKTEEELRKIAGDRILYAHDDQYRDMTNERNLTKTVDKVIEGITDGNLSAVTNGEIHTAIKNDDTGMLRDSITSSAVAVDRKDYATAAKNAGIGGFIMDSNGTLYRVVSMDSGSSLLGGGQAELYDVDTGKIVKVGSSGGGGGGLLQNGMNKGAEVVGNLF